MVENISTKLKSDRTFGQLKGNAIFVDIESNMVCRKLDQMWKCTELSYPPNAVVLGSGEFVFLNDERNVREVNVTVTITEV